MMDYEAIHFKPKPSSSPQSTGTMVSRQPKWIFLFIIAIVTVQGLLVFWKANNAVVEERPSNDALDPRFFMQHTTTNMHQPSSFHTSGEVMTLNSTILHVLFALSGNLPSLLRELEVALKSVLLHAPPDLPLTIHIIADTSAYQSLEMIWNVSQVASWKTRNPTSIQTYHIEATTIQKWKFQVRQYFQKQGYSKSQMHLLLEHTIGTYFRLYADQILSTSSKDKYVLYMDPDVVLLANLQQLWKEILTIPDDDDKLFYWSSTMCAGFIILNVPQIPRIWELASDTQNLKAIAGRLGHRPNDQLILRVINLTYPQHVGLLSQAWDGNIADGLYKFAKRIVEKRPKLGMLHFNGGATDETAYFESHSILKNPDTQHTVGLIMEQVYLPWTWARFRVESVTRIGGTSYPMVLNYTSRFDAG